MSPGNQHTVNSVIKAEDDSPALPGEKFDTSSETMNAMKGSGWGWKPPQDALKEADKQEAAAKEEKKDEKKEEKKA